ncbi:MAG: J domain-containing protein [Pseudomonadota bacterium]
MANLSPEIRHAFECLGVSPGADSKTIRTAWRAMVRAYHPDQVKGNKAEANRRLAEMNAAYDLVSDWSPEDAKAYTQASTKKRTCQRAAKAAKAAKMRKAAAARQAKAEADVQRRKFAERQARENAARRRAAELDRKETAQRAASRRHRSTAAFKTSAHARFLVSLSQLMPTPPSRHSLSV